MILLVLFLLGVVGTWIIKAWCFFLGATCSIMGLSGLIACIVILIRGVFPELYGMYLTVSIFSLLLGLFFFWILYHKKFEERRKQKQISTPPYQFSDPALEAYTQDGNN